MYRWKLNNGAIENNDEIAVTDEENCLETITKHKQNYFLILRDTSNEIDGVNIYEQRAPIVSSKKSSHRRIVWNSVCGESPSDESCQTTISRDVLKPIVVLYKGMNTVLRCKVLSGSVVSSIIWYKDGVDIDADGGGSYAIAGIFVYYTDNEKSDLLIINANGDHTGNYKCVATDENGGRTEATTRVRVLGKGTESQYAKCDSKDASLCFHGGVCRQIYNEPFCECQNGFHGDRCQHSYIATEGHGPRISNNFHMNEEITNLNSEITGLKIGYVAFSLLFVVSLVTMYAACRPKRENKKHAGSSTKDNVSNNSRTSVTMIHESKHTRNSVSSSPVHNELKIPNSSSFNYTQTGSASPHLKVPLTPRSRLAAERS